MAYKSRFDKTCFHCKKKWSTENMSINDDGKCYVWTRIDEPLVDWFECPKCNKQMGVDLKEVLRKKKLWKEATDG